MHEMALSELELRRLITGGETHKDANLCFWSRQVVQLH